MKGPRRNHIRFAALLVAFFLPAAFVFAATTTPASDLPALIAQLKKQIEQLQVQVQSLQGELQAVKTELKFTRALQRGASGEDVKELQEFLATRHPDLYPEGLVTGFFGPLTEQAVRRWQERQGFEAVGAVGPRTRAKLNELLAEGAGESGLIPPGLLRAPGLERLGVTTTQPVATSTTPFPTPPFPQPGTTTPPAMPPGTILPSPPAATSTPLAPVAPPPPPPAAGTPPPPPTVALPSGATWVRLIGGSGYEFGRAVSVDGSGNAYLAGSTQSSLDGQAPAGLDDAFLAKYDATGTRLWTRLVGNAGSDDFETVAADSGGNVYAGGSTQGTIDGQPAGALLVKFDANGTKLWIHTLGVAGNRIVALAADQSGNVYAAGTASGSIDGQGYAGGSTDMFLTKYSSAGARLWTRLRGSAATDIPEAVAVDASGNVFMAGWAGGLVGLESFAGGSYDAFVGKYDSGSLNLWQRLVGSSRNEYAQGVGVDGAGNVYIIGYAEASFDGQTIAGGAAGSNYDAFVTKFDTRGTKAWTRFFGGTASEYVTSGAVDAGGNAHIGGYVDGALDGMANAGANDAYVMKVDANGARVGSRLLGTSGHDEAYGLAVDAGGNPYLAGIIRDSTGLPDAFLAKYSPPQTTSITPPPPPPAPPPASPSPPSTSTTTTATTTTATPPPAPPPPPPPPSIPQVQGLTATVSGGSVALSWQDVTGTYSLAGLTSSPSTSMFGSYNIYRGSSADFTPSPIPSNPTNLIVQGSVLSYTDANLPAGTYYYKIALHDKNGVVGPASEAVSAQIFAHALTVRGRVVNAITREPVVNSNMYIWNWKGSTRRDFYLQPDATFAINLTADDFANANAMYVNEVYNNGRACFDQSSFTILKTASGSVDYIHVQEVVSGYPPTARRVTPVGAEANIGDLLVWPVTGFSLTSDIPVKFSATYENGTGGGGNINYRTGHGFSTLYPVNIGTRITLTDQSGNQYVSSYVKYGLSQHCSNVTLNYASGQFSWTPPGTISARDSGASFASLLSALAESLRQLGILLERAR